MYGLELNEQIKKFDCPECGKECLTVWGFISKHNAAHAIYYAGLMTGHEQSSVQLTISIGGWGRDTVDEESVEGRDWLYLEARPTADSYEMMVREAEESSYFGKGILGKPMSRTAALSSHLLEEFFSVADFIAFNDPAVNSYLLGQEISESGRKGID